LHGSTLTIPLHYCSTNCYQNILAKHSIKIICCYLKVCYLLQCKHPSQCEDIIPSPFRIKSQIIFLNKTTSTSRRERFCPKQNTVGIVWDKTPARLTATQQCPREANGLCID